MALLLAEDSKESFSVKDKLQSSHYPNFLNVGYTIQALHVY